MDEQAVWAVTRHYFDSWDGHWYSTDILAVFSTEEEAEAYKDSLDDPSNCEVCESVFKRG